MALTDTMRNRIVELIGARPSDCSPAMWDVLGVLRGCTGAATVTGDWSYAEVAGLAACTPATARKAVRSLTERGYIAVCESGCAGRYRLSAGDVAAAGRNMRTPAVRKISEPVPANTGLGVAVEPMTGVVDATACIPSLGSSARARRSVIRPRRTGTRLVTDHETPRGRVFRLVNVERCRESARALAAAMSEDRGEVRAGFLARMSRDTTEAAYEPRHLAEDGRSFWQRAVVPVGMTTIILGSVAMLIATAADAQSAMSAVPEVPEVLVGEQWETVNPGVDEPTENASRGTNDNMVGLTPTTGGEAAANTPAAERGATDMLVDEDATDVQVTIPGVDTATVAGEKAAGEAMLVIPPVQAPSTYVTDATGTVWEIAADGTVLGAVQANHEGSSTLRDQVDTHADYPWDDSGASVDFGELEPSEAEKSDLPLDGEDAAVALPACVGAWDVFYTADGDSYTVNEDGRECTLPDTPNETPSNLDGEAPGSDAEAGAVPEVGESDSESF